MHPILRKRPVTDAEFAALMRNMSDYEKDLCVPCPHKECLTAPGHPCKNMGRGRVHLGRRIKRLMGGFK